MANSEQGIIVVGAGPTGLALAAELKRLGKDALVLDRLPAGENTSRAAVVHARTLEVLEPLSVTTNMIASGVIVPTFRIRDRSRVLTTISFSDLKTAYPYTLMCPQNVTESILLKRLEELGGRVERPCTVTGIHQADGHVEVSYESNGDHHTSHAKWVVGCDGAHSLVREQAAIPFEGSTYDESFILADVEMDWPLARDEVSLLFSEEGLLVVAPLPGNHFRIVATVRQVNAVPSMIDFQNVLDERGPEWEAGRITCMVWSSRFRVGHKVAKRFFSGRILLAGDAAHVHSPAGGQGMNTGIQDAISLAGVLTSSTGDLRDNLEDWNEKRQKIAHSVVRITDRLTRVATASSGGIKLLRNALIEIFGQLPFAQHSLAEKLAELNN